jgi:hypothetical protein
MLDADGGEFGAPQRAGEAKEQQGAVAQAGQVGRDRLEDLAQNRRSGGEFPGRQLAGSGGGAVHASHGLGDLRLGGRHRAAADEMQIADGGAAQVHGGDAEAAAAFGGEEGNHVGGPGGQAGQRVAVAPGAPGPHPGAISAPGIGRRGPPGIGIRGDAGGGEGSVVVWDDGLGRVVKPGAHAGRRLIERCRDKDRRRSQDRQVVRRGRGKRVGAGFRGGGAV